MNTSNDARQYAPATERNREFILEVLLRVLPPIRCQQTTFLVVFQRSSDS